MRPKVVILTMLVAFGLLGAIAVFKGMQGKHADDLGVQTPGQLATTNSGSGGVANTKGPEGGTNPVAVSPELQAAITAKQIEQIQELQGEVDGTNNPTIIQALLDKVMQPEEDVRKAALEAIKEIDDTNAIPGLQKAADGIQDARTKVAVLDVIDYLKLPSAMPDVQPPETLTNATSFGVILPDDKMNPHFLRKKKDGTAQNSTSNGSAN
ncbi:MAG TPA: HEAT repeat domain-containing protein [Verrucomicrobiae bacterium]|jgi:hypothetical protein|nr:HEAT repeat domain-containing protein [Verrucomicrobiae bacterium]